MNKRELMLSLLLCFAIIALVVFHHEKRNKVNSVNYTHKQVGLSLQHVTVNGVDCVIFQSKSGTAIDCDF